MPFHFFAGLFNKDLKHRRSGYLVVNSLFLQKRIQRRAAVGILSLSHTLPFVGELLSKLPEASFVSFSRRAVHQDELVAILKKEHSGFAFFDTHTQFP